MKTLKCLVIAAIVFCVVESSSVDVLTVLQNVPKEDREDFIRYYSSLGYELSLKTKIKEEDDNDGENAIDTAKDLDAMGDFAVRLYKWLLKKHSLRNPSRWYMSRHTVICFPNGRCVNIGDMGVHP